MTRPRWYYCKETPPQALNTYSNKGIHMARLADEPTEKEYDLYGIRVIEEAEDDRHERSQKILK